MFVAMDCEMVKSQNEQIIARVSIVGQKGNVLLDEYVKPTAVVTDYVTHISGITKEHLENGKSLTEVQSLVVNLINGHVLVGHSLQNDLRYLGLPHLKYHQRDLAKYGPFMKNRQPQSLKALAGIYLGKTIQEGVHDSVEDAQTAMELHNKVANNWNKQYLGSLNIN